MKPCILITNDDGINAPGLRVLEDIAREIAGTSDEAFVDLSDAAQTSNGWARCTRLAVCDAEGRPGSTFVLRHAIVEYCAVAVDVVGADIDLEGLTQRSEALSLVHEYLGDGDTSGG